MVMPAGAVSFKEALRMGTEVFHNLKTVLNLEDIILLLVMKEDLLQI